MESGGAGGAAASSALVAAAPRGNRAAGGERLRCHSLRFGAHLSLFLRPVLGAMGAAELTREADDAMQSLLSEYVSLLGAVGAAAVAAVDSRAAAAAAAAPFGPSGGGEEEPTLQQMAYSLKSLRIEREHFLR